MFARKKTTQPCEQTSHLLAAMFIWDFGRSRCEVESLQIFFYYCRGDPALRWWVAPHEDEGMGTRPWNRQIHSGQSISDWWLSRLSPSRFERFCVFFVPTQNRQNALKHFLFWPKKQFPTSSALNNRALILIGGSGCYCNANTWRGWPLRFWHISGTI